MDTAENWVSGLSILFVVVFIVVVTIFGITELKLKKFCNDNGYPKYSVTYDLSQYCIKRVDQTDIVISKDKVKK